jgi:hypothetical protein
MNRFTSLFEIIVVIMYATTMRIINMIINV